jgi:hypothetical protein
VVTPHYADISHVLPVRFYQLVKNIQDYCPTSPDGQRITRARRGTALNGRRLTLTNDAAYDLVMAVAAGELDSVDEIATVVRQATRPAR